MTQHKVQTAIAAEVRSTGSLLDKKPVNKYYVLPEEKLDEIGAKSEHTSENIGPPCIRDQHPETASSQSYLNMRHIMWL